MTADPADRKDEDGRIRRMSSTTLDAVRRLATAFGSSDPAALSQAIDQELVATFVTHGDALFPLGYGRDALKQRVLELKSAFPDATATIQHLFGEANKAMMHARIEGTQQQEWRSLPPTGRRVAWTVTALVRFNDEGQLVEGWVIQDTLGLLQQLGQIERIPGQGG